MKYNLFVISLLMLSCSDQSSEKADKVHEQNIAKSSNSSLPPPSLGEHIDRNDKYCVSEIEKAKSDFKSGKLVYSKYGDILLRHDEELEELLSKFNITYNPLGENCLRDLNCYGVYMDSLIAEKYGETFIDNLSKVADHMFQARWATKTYEYWDVDIEPKYGNVSPDTFILRKLNLPIGWDYEPMRNERQFVDAEFIIDTTGAVSNIKVGDLGHNFKSTNKKYLGYFKKEIKNIIEEMTPWEAAIFNSHKVKCWYLVDINLDK